MAICKTCVGLMSYDRVIISLWPFRLHIREIERIKSAAGLGSRKQ